MSDIKKIEKLFAIGKKSIISIINKHEKLSNYFWINSEISREIKKGLYSTYKKEKVDLSSFPTMTEKDKNKVILAFEDMILCYESESRWQVTSLIHCVLKMCNAIFDSEKSFINMSHYYISSNLTNESVSEALLRDGYFKSMSIFSDILNNYSEEQSIRVLELCISKCSSSLLEKFKKHKNKNIRLIVYQRLGIENCFEEMLKDKDRNVRLEALNYAPRDHEALSCLYGDRSKYVISKLITLISREKAIFILGNAKVQKNSYLQNLLREKINGAW